jgi:hypothetical protein
VIDSKTGTGRIVLRQDEVDAFQPGGSLVIDDRRRRPLYFDGRFLAARDLVREQAYFLTRQSDIARFAGFGAMQGLMVRQLSSNLADAVTISAGQGVTPSGELVIIPQDHTISLSNVPEDQKLNANFGLLPLPKESPINRSGLYVLGLRPVEFSANPIASYPTTITGPRTVHDGDIIEATAITLVPFPDSGTSLNLSMRRSYAAREIFLSSALRGVPAGVLPLAMVGLNHGNVEWVDSYMVRREVGAEYGDLLRFGMGNRATQQAFILQYDAQLNEVLSQRQHAGQGTSFPAGQYFYALPPCGRMPMACINTESFTQSFFPQETNVTLSVAPSDEMPSLIEQAVGLPPIDLMQPAQAFANISVLVLAPVSRQQFAQIKAKLQAVPLHPTIPAAIAARAPLDLLRLKRGPLSTDPVVLPPTTTANAFWKDVVATPFLYYLRLRSAPVAVEITSPSAAPVTHPVEPPKPEPPKPSPAPPQPTPEVPKPEPPKPPTPEPPKPPVPEPPKPPVPEPPKPVPEPPKPVPQPPHPPVPEPPKPPVPEPPKPVPQPPHPPIPQPPKPVPQPPHPPIPVPPPPPRPIPQPPKPPAPKPGGVVVPAPPPKPPAPKPPAPRPPTPQPQKPPAPTPPKPRPVPPPAPRPAPPKPPLKKP